jgi:hypothetical protein
MTSQKNKKFFQNPLTNAKGFGIIIIEKEKEIKKMYLERLETQLIEIVNDIYYDNDGDDAIKEELISVITTIINDAWDSIENGEF